MNSAFFRKQLFILLSCIVLVFFLSACAPGKQIFTEQGFLLDTYVSVTYYDEKDRPAVLDALELCRSCEKVFSCHDRESELYRINANDGGQVSDELLTVLETALAFCERSGGKFDITMGGVSGLYGFSEPEHHVPDENELKEALSHSDYRLVSIKGNTVSIADPETIIDLGAIAKGFIADKMKTLLVEQGVENAIISLGGNVLTLGGRPDGTEFEIGIQYPEPGSSELISTVHVRDLSVVTSGVYERCFEKNGRIYHHILDSDTGLPADSGLLSVSVIGPESMICDALSTVCFVLGPENGLAIIEEMQDYEALFVTETEEIIMSSGFEAFTER